MKKEYLMREIRREYNYFNSNHLTRPEYIGSIVGRIEAYTEILFELDMITSNGYDLLAGLTNRMLQSI